MSSMSALLADVFQTKTASAITHTSEDLEKQANFEFFGALCQKEGIDVSKLTDAKVESLFKVAMEIKAAAEHEGKEPPKEEKIEEAAKAKEKEKEAAARAEYQEKRAAAVKVAEAEAMGRVMAHAYIDELKKIAAAADEADEKGEKGKPAFPFGKKEGKEGKEGEKEKEKDASARADELIAAFEQMKTAGATVPAGTTTTPNFDEFAAHHAIAMLKQAGVNEEVAFARVNAVYTLGLPESVKMASATSEAKALEYRALEICDAAGFQVDWTQVS